MKKPPIRQEAGRKELVRQMFDSIAGRYDLLNHLLSMGIDKRWRKRLIRELSSDHPAHILDLATGTADLAIMAANASIEKITGTDISAKMLEIGRQKIKEKGLTGKIDLLIADSEHLPFPEQSFDAAMVAYGVRNYENLPLGLSEMHRVLKPGARAFILEFSRPDQFPVKQLYAFYFRYILPWIGRLVSRNNGAYTYLPESVKVFPQGDEFLQLMTEGGFTSVQAYPLSFGITTLYIGTR